jgi:WD40 repeat protein
MNIYDLDAIKNRNSTEDKLLVHTLAVEFPFDKILMDETAIICEGKYKFRILDFGFLEYFRSEAKSVTLSLPWRSVWRRKGVDEEPLEPVHHMDVYREVLQYYHELSKNCQRAIDTYPVFDPDMESFNLGDDFIGYRELNPRMVIYDKNMNRKSQEIDYKTVQISQTTRLSVKGKAIKLIDVTTGDIIKEMKLERDVTDFHFGGNRLVFVSKTAEGERLLSVWKIENSSKLTRIIDVVIGDRFSPYNYQDSLQVDEHLIAVNTLIGDGKTTCNLTSLKTFEIERSLSCDNRFHCFYDRGFLFFTNNSRRFVRILDVASGSFLHDMPIEQSFCNSVITRSNSNYVVVAAMNIYSKLFIYDLKCLRETDTAPSHLLLTSIDLECKIEAMMMNENRIVCLSDREMYVVDLKPIDRLRCPESC